MACAEVGRPWGESSVKGVGVGAGRQLGVARQGCQFEVHGVGRANNGAGCQGVERRWRRGWDGRGREGKNSENREHGSDSLEKKHAENPFNGEGRVFWHAFKGRRGLGTARHCTLTASSSPGRGNRPGCQDMQRVLRPG